MGCKLLIEAPVNGGRNYNGPKVNDTLALVKLGYMLESLEHPAVRGASGVTIRPVQTISRKGPEQSGNPQRLYARRPRGRRYSPSCMATCRGRQK